MALPADLLAQARVLANLDTKRPKQANLRRAISTAYYAVFHLLCAACVQRFSPARPLRLAARISRALAHGEMKDVCASLLRQQPPPALAELQPGRFSEDFKVIADHFVQLQEERHAADYDTEQSYTRAEALAAIGFSDEVFAKWELVRTTDEATVFLAALLFAKRWSR